MSIVSFLRIKFNSQAKITEDIDQGSEITRKKLIQGILSFLFKMVTVEYCN